MGAEPLNRYQQLMNEYPEELEALLKRAAAEGAGKALRVVKNEADDDWVSKEEAMRLLNCGYRALQNKVRKGHIRKSGGSRNEQKFYNRADIDAYKRGERKRHKP